MDTLPKIRTVYQNPKATIDQLTAAAVGARSIATEAEGDVAEMVAQRPDKLLAGDPKEITSFDQIMATGRATVESARALAEACDGRAATLRAEVAERGRRERYEAAKAQTAALRAPVEKDYAELVRLGRSIVERIGRAREAARAANADLPAGAAPLPDVESFRQVPSLPRRVVSAKLVGLYVAENGQPLPSQDLRPRPNDMGWAGGYLKEDEHGYELEPHTVERLYRRWTFVEYETESAVSFKNPGPFAAELVIPALYGQKPEGWRLGHGASLDGALHVLAHADDPLPEPARAPSETRTVRLERFEQEWGPFDALACNAEAVPAQAPSGLKRLVG